MKRIATVILTVIMALSLPISAFASLSDSDTTFKEFELWAMSPCITGGMTQEDMVLQRAIQRNSVNFYPLPELGENYYLAQTAGWLRNSGYSGKTETAYVRYYIVLMTDSDYIIIDSKELFSDYSSISPIIYNLADKTVKPDKGDRALYAICTYYPYTHSGWTSWEECLFITENKKFALKTQENENGYTNDDSTYFYDGKIYWGTVKTNSIYLRPMYFENGTVTEGTNVSHPVSEITEANGYVKMNNEYADLGKYGVSVKQYYSIPGSSNRFYTISFEDSPQSTSTTNKTKDLVVTLSEKNGSLPKVINQSRVYTDSTNTSINDSQNLSIINMDEDYYRNMGYSVPCAILLNKYIITNDGTVGKLNLDTSIFYSSSYYNFGTYKNRLVVARCRNGSSYIYKTEADGTRAYYQIVNYIYVNNKGGVELGPDIEIKTVGYSEHDPEQNGFYYNTSSFNKSTNLVEQKPISAETYFGTLKTNYFSDGRYITGEWSYMGEMYEFYYAIYSPEGKLLAYGPTGYRVTSSTSDFEPFIIIESDSKFIVSTDDLTYDKMREFYKVADIINNEDNETSVGSTIGNKNLNPGVETDTVPVESIIDFSKDELPIGFNLRDNVVDSDKLDAELREQINTIRLSDIVIVKSDDIETGVQNTGTTLDEFSISDDSFGKCNILFYTNGQNFGWSCQAPSKLNAGTYNKYYNIGDKTVYVTIKIVDAPKNSGNVVVTF